MSTSYDDYLSHSDGEPEQGRKQERRDDGKGKEEESPEPERKTPPLPLSHSLDGLDLSPRRSSDGSGSSQGGMVEVPIERSGPRRLQLPQPRQAGGPSSSRSSSGSKKSASFWGRLRGGIAGIQEAAAARSAASKWDQYHGSLGGDEIVPGVDHPMARATVSHKSDEAGVKSHVISLHKYGKQGWSKAGQIKMDRSSELDGSYSDRSLNMHMDSGGGTPNAGLARALFPASIGWIDNNLRGVEEVTLQPSGGAASKTVMASLSQQLGEPHLNQAAEEVGQRRRDAAGPPLGHEAPVNEQISTWDTRLNEEYFLQMSALRHSPHAGLSVSTGSAMTLAGSVPADQADIVKQHRDALNEKGADHFSRDPDHPAAQEFENARRLGDEEIEHDPAAAALRIQMAHLSMLSGPNGRGGDAGGQHFVQLSGEALAHVLPNATLPPDVPSDDSGYDPDSDSE